MAKRFFDPKRWDRAYRKLDPKIRMLHFYLWLHCDEAGFFEKDLDKFEFETGFEYSEDDLQKLPEYIDWGDDLAQLGDFLQINYNGEVKENYNPHKPIFTALERRGLGLDQVLSRLKSNLAPTLPQPCPNLAPTLPQGSKETHSTFNKSPSNLIDIDKDKEVDKEKGGVGENKNKHHPPTDFTFSEICRHLREGDQWREQQCIQLNEHWGHRLSKAAWVQWVKEFEKEKLLEGDYHGKDLRNCRKWFSNWLRMKLKSKGKGRVIPLPQQNEVPYRKLPQSRKLK